MTENDKVSKEEMDALFSFSEIDEKEKDDTMNLNTLLDISLEVVVELGRTKTKISEVLDLSNGSIIELNRFSGEPVDLLVNKKIVAKGEVVVVDENFGIRLTEILKKPLTIEEVK